jgi:hypothetical protein
LQQVAQYVSRVEIVHNLAIAGLASGVLVGVAFVLAIIDAIIVAHKRNKFVEQYIYEHGKGKG